MNRGIALILTSALITLVPVTLHAQARGFAALPTPQAVESGSKIEVREFFWYGCPHCYAVEPIVERWLKRKPANVEFIRTPATAPRWLVHAQAFYAFEALGATAKTHSALFKALHEKNRKLENQEALAEFAAEQGLEAAKFREAFNSFGVRTKLEKAKRINEVYGVTSVPMFSVDGKYMTSAELAGGDEAVMTVVDQLVQKAAQERAAKRGAGK
jgi:thiol:disulfide interchange protein DsbA